MRRILYPSRTIHEVNLLGIYTKPTIHMLWPRISIDKSTYLEWFPPGNNYVANHGLRVFLELVEHVPGNSPSFDKFIGPILRVKIISLQSLRN
jgi:hypothetical protein